MKEHDCGCGDLTCNTKIAIFHLKDLEMIQIAIFRDDEAIATIYLDRGGMERFIGELADIYTQTTSVSIEEARAKGWIR